MNNFDQNSIKIPGYNVVLPKSWDSHGFARILVYVKSSFQYQQVHALENSSVQSIWIKVGFQGSKQIYFCHTYREHTSTMGISINVQRTYLETLVSQWEEALFHKSNTRSNEVHIMGDFNIDMLKQNWLRPDYYLSSLSKILQAACKLGNFEQLLQKPTRFQFNSGKGITEESCIDHIYTNHKFRCSPVFYNIFWYKRS